MNTYHKIQNVFKRDMSPGGTKRLIDKDWSRPEFEYLANCMWVATEKVDGMNIRVMHFEEGGVQFGGKSDNAQIPSNLVTRLQERFLPGETISLLREMFPDCDACLYGEGYGAGIQKGGTYRQDQDFVLFDVRVGDWWLQRLDVEDVANKLGLDVVPIIERATLSGLVCTIATGGFNSRWGDFPAEGYVARPQCELVARNGQRIITKIKTKDFG